MFLTKEAYTSHSESNGHFLFSGTDSYETTDDYSNPDDGSQGYSFTDWSRVEDGRKTLW